MANEMLIDKFVTLLFDGNNKRHHIVNDGGHGPMSTGSDEWSSYGDGEIGKIMGYERAMKVAQNPDIGYAKAPMPSTRIVYQIILKPVATFDTDPTEEKRRQEKLKQNALKKLSSEERKVLGLE